MVFQCQSPDECIQSIRGLGHQLTLVGEIGRRARRKVREFEIEELYNLNMDMFIISGGKTETDNLYGVTGNN